MDRALAPLLGANLLSLPLPLVEELLSANPWVEGVTVEKRLPNELRVSVVERRPAALLRDGDRRWSTSTSRAGRSRSFDPLRGPRDLLLVSVSPATGAAPAGAFAVARELEASAPLWAASLSEVEVLGEGDFRLYLGALTFPAAGARWNPQGEAGGAREAPAQAEPALREARIHRSPIRSSDHSFNPHSREGPGSWPKQNSTS